MQISLLVHIGISIDQQNAAWFESFPLYVDFNFVPSWLLTPDTSDSARYMTSVNIKKIETHF